MRAKDWVRTAAALLCVACSTSDRFTDAGPGGEAGGGDRDGGPPPTDGGREGGRLGDPCRSTSACGARLFCDTEVDISYPAENLPPTIDEVPYSAFPGGVCTPVPAATYDPTGADSCDPLAPVPHQGCGNDGVCVAVDLDNETVVACRPQCDPNDETSCGRFGYQCHYDLEACVEGCQSDEECRLLLVDGDDDGAPDSIAYDDESLAFCDPDSSRCRHSGGGSAVTGDPCERLDDCEQDGLCIQPLQTFAGLRFPGGACSKLGCNLDGRECAGDGATCGRLRSWTPGLVTDYACMTSCTVGAEPAEDQIGAEGHGQGCRPGYRCHYNGGAGAQSGVCVGGNYNAVADNNVGAACESDADCYSPFGLGSCVFLQIADVAAEVGACSLRDCNAPGIPDDVCGTGNECIGLNGDVSFCVKDCTKTEECPEGYACSDDDGNPASPRICYPACFADAECREGEVCEPTPMGAGTCVASGR